MVLGEIVIALLTTLFVSLVFYIIFGYKGKWGNFWVFYFIIFGITLFSTIWIGPNNNNYDLIGWLPVLFISMISGATLASITVPMKRSAKWNTDRPEKTTIVTDRKMVTYSTILMAALLVLVFAVMI